MSVFSDNITNDLSKTEMIRIWFLKQIGEQIEDWKIEYNGVSEYIFLQNYQLFNILHTDIVDRWLKRCWEDLRIMGVVSTITDVKQKIDKNKFKVVVNFLQQGNTDYDIVESDWFAI